MNVPDKSPATGAVGLGVRIIGTLFFLVFLGMGLVFVWLVGRDALAGLRTWSWNATECEITRSEARGTDSQGSKSEDFYFDVEYRYNFQGQIYTSGQYRLSRASFADYSKVARLIETYAPGARAVCYVNRASPKEAVLERGSLIFPLVTFFPMIFVAIGAGGIYALWKRRSPKPAGIRPISDNATKALGRRFATVFFGAFIIIGAVVFYFVSVRPLSEMLQARQWPAVSCTIISSGVRSHRGDNGHTYSVNVFYSYVFNDREYKANRYDFMGVSSSGYAAKQAIVSRYPPGSTSVCYVNPDNPNQAVLERGFTPMMWLGLIPLGFCLFGLVGLSSTRRKARQEIPVTGASAIFKLRDSATGSAAGLPEAEYGSSLTLQPAVAPLAKLVVTVIVALFWNGIISIFAFQVLKSWRAGHLEWFLALFLTPFVLIGAGMIVAIGYFFLALFNPRPRLTVSPGTPRLGDSVRVDWEIMGRVESIQRLQVCLEAREEATYTNGDSTSTDRSVFARLELGSGTLPQEMQAGSGRVTIPADLMHSFTSKHNKVVWSIRVEGSIGLWPDLNEEFVLTVLPGTAKPMEDL